MQALLQAINFRPFVLGTKYKALSQIIAIAIMFIWISLCYAQKPLDDNAIIKMHAAGLSDDIIVSTINNESGAYATSADDLIALKKAGISDKVIGAIISKHSGTTSSPTIQPMVPGYSVFTPGTVSVKYKKGDQWVAIRPETFYEKSGGMLKLFASGGMRLPDMNGHINGKNSKLALTTPVTIRVSLPNGFQISNCDLIKFHVNHDNREFRANSGGFMSASTEWSHKDSVKFDAKQVDARTYDIALPIGTPPGEYGLNIGSATEIYTFSISK
jgi:hypothetical protein